MAFVLFLKADSEKVVVSVNDETKELSSKEWEAGRELSNQLLNVILEICASADISLENLSGIIVYQGPGSYTGLRISISVGNALGYSMKIPVVGSSGKNWQVEGLEKFTDSKIFVPIAPIYGGEVYTTKPVK